MNRLRTFELGALVLGTLGATATALDTGPDDGPGAPRRDRHGKHTRPEKTQFTSSKNKSESLKRLLKK